MEVIIKDFPRYTISTDGVVFSSYSNKALNFDTARGGYKRVTLYKAGRSKRLMVHRLVATHFIANPDNLPEVNHLNGDKADNNALNLEWVTGSQNCQHAIDNRLYEVAVGEAYGRSNLTTDDILSIRAKWAENNSSQSQLASLYHTTRSNINNIVNRYTWKHV